MKLKDAHKLVMGASCPEDVFGKPYTLPDAQKAYRKLATVLHPDKYTKKADQSLATEGFAALLSWHKLAVKKAAEGIYGDPMALAKPITLVTKKNTYIASRRHPGTDICDMYVARASANGGKTINAGTDVLLKVPRSPINNDLMKAEADILKLLVDHSGALIKHHIRPLVDSFELVQGAVRKRVNVVKPLQGYIRLQDVLDAYPKGIHVLDAAWMFNRLLGAILGAHQAGVVHGNVTPATFYICIDAPDTHNGVLTDWTRAVKVGGTVKSINTAYRYHYPDEILKKQPVGPGTDIYMAAMCMLRLIGGENNKGCLLYPKGTHPALRGLLNACFLGRAHRTADAAELHEDFAKLTGPRKFRKFAMPTPGVA